MMLTPLNYPQMMSLHLDDKLAVQLFITAKIAPQPEQLHPGDATLLDEWADGSDNPRGQKANLARAVAALIKVGDGLTISRQVSPPPGTFWDATR